MTTQAIAENPVAPAVAATPARSFGLRLPTILTTPDFIQTSIGNAVVHTGLRLPSVAVAWLVLELTGSRLALGLVNGLPALAAVAFSLVGGVLADGRDPRAVLIRTRATLAAVWFLAAVLVTTGQVEMAYLALVLLVAAAATAIDMPVGRTVLFEVVGRERLLSATAASSMVVNLLNIAGPIGLGLLIGSAGVDFALYTVAAAYVVALLLAASTRGGRTEKASPPTRPLRDLREGVSYLRSTPTVGWLVSLSFLVPVAGVFFAMVPLYAREVLAVGPGGLGLMLTIYGSGGLAGSTFLAVRGRVRRRGLVLALLGFAFGAGMVVFALSHSYAVSCGIGFFMGLTAMLWQNTLSAVVQTSAEPAMRGRVMSVYTMGIQLIGLGWLVGGVASALVGVEVALATAGAAFLAFNALVFLRSPAVRAID